MLQRDDVYCAHEDPVGFIWLCTDAGLARFDGEQTVTFGSEAGQLRALLQERDGSIWVAGRNGVFEFVMAAAPWTGSIPAARIADGASGLRPRNRASPRRLHPVRHGSGA